MISLILLLSFFHSLTPNRVPVTWTAGSGVYSDTLVLVNNYVADTTNTTASPAGYLINFGITFVNVPRLALGINSFEFDSTSQNTVICENFYSTISTTGYSHYVTLSTNIKYLNINYLAVDATVNPFFLIYNKTTPLIGLSSGTGYRTQVFQIVPSFGDVFNISHNNGLITWMAAFSMDSNSGTNSNSGINSNFEFGIFAVIVTPTLYNATFWTNGTTTLTYGGYYRLFFDLTEIEQTQYDYFDYGLVSGTNSVQSSWPTIPFLSPNAFFFGLTYFNFAATAAGNTAQWAIQTSSPYNLDSTSGYNSINIYYWNYRHRSCPVAYPNYNSADDYCYDICPISTFSNTTYSFCVSCDSSCLNCTDATSISCTACDTTRTLQTNQCICASAYYQNGAVCSSCNIQCLTCTGSTNSDCVTCNASAFRQLSGTSCICMTGYTDNGSGTCNLACTVSNCNVCSGSSCTICDSGYLIQGNSCASCNTVFTGCLTCNDSIACLTCDPTLNLILNGTICSCITGYGINSTTGLCQSCTIFDSSCSACSATQCVSCNSPFMISIAGTCLCPASTYYISTPSISCALCDSSCLNCTGPNNNQCSACFATFGLLSNNSCGCITGTYLTSNTCSACDSTCLSCVGANDNQCTACYSTFILQSNNSCNCPLSTYFASPICVSCDYSCLTCNASSNTSCLTCNSTDQRTLLNNTCACNPFYTDNNTALCITLVCNNTYFVNSVGVCQQICGDGLLFVLPCDDGNLINGDGCSSVCQIESEFKCFDGNNTHRTTCSYTEPLSINLICQIKDPNSNILKITLDINPKLSALINQDFNQLMTNSLSNQDTTYTYDNGILTALIYYYTNIQYQIINMTFNSQSVPELSLIPSTSTLFQIKPCNNLSAIYYDILEYQQAKFYGFFVSFLMYFSLGTFLIGLYLSKFIGVQMMWVIQLSYLGLMTVQNLSPLEQKLTTMTYINGINTYYQNVNDGILSPSLLEYRRPFIYNLNYMILTMVTPFVIGILILILSSKQKYQQLRTLGLRCMCEYGLTIALFSLYNFSISTTLFLSKPINSLLSWSGILFCVFLLIILLLKFYSHPTSFGEYKQAFQDTLFAQYYYYFLILDKILTGILLAVLNSYTYVGFIMIALSTFSFGLLLIKKPYLNVRNNYRAIFNQIVVVFTWVVYSMFKNETAPSLNGLWNAGLSYVQLILLYLVVVLNLSLMIREKIDKAKQNRISNSSTIMDISRTEVEPFQIQKPVFIWSSKYKSSTINIINNKVIQTNHVLYIDQNTILLQPPLQNQTKQCSLRVCHIETSIAIGICLRRNQRCQQFGIESLEENNHGLYMIANDGLVFSDHDPRINNTISEFKYIKDDIIVVKYDSKNCVLQLRKKFTEESIEIQYKRCSNHFYYLCVYLLGKDSEVELQNQEFIIKI